MGLQTNGLRQDLCQRCNELSSHINDLAHAKTLDDSPCLQVGWHG